MVGGGGSHKIYNSYAKETGVKMLSVKTCDALVVESTLTGAHWKQFERACGWHESIAYGEHKGWTHGNRQASNTSGTKDGET